MYVITSKWSLNFKLNTTPTPHLEQITHQIYTQANWDQPPPAMPSYYCENDIYAW